MTASPNQTHKRSQIIDAARVVLARDGLAGCTARAVADASPLTKSAIHYYFRDIDEVVDLAVAAHLDAMLASLRRVSADHTDPRRRLHAVIRVYLDTFVAMPHAAFLWFEYWIGTGRRGSVAGVAHMLDEVRSLLVELLAPVAPGDHERRATVLLSWLLGSIVQQHAHPGVAATDAEIDDVLAALCTM